MASLVQTLRSSWKAILAEFFGTFLLVFLCVATGFRWDGTPVNNVQISLTNGLTVATLIQIFGHVSGCHINPAVTLSMLLFKHVQPIVAGLYIVSQLFGAAMGAALLQSLTPEAVHGGFGVVLPNGNVSHGQAFGMEFAITFILLLIIFAVSDENRVDIQGSIPLAVGLTVAALSLIANGYTGACMNPARSFGPAVVTQNWTEHWIYWIGPCAGGMAGATVYHNAFRVRPQAIPKKDTIFSHQVMEELKTEELKY